MKKQFIFIALLLTMVSFWMSSNLNAKTIKYSEDKIRWNSLSCVEIGFKKYYSVMGESGIKWNFPPPWDCKAKAKIYKFKDSLCKCEPEHQSHDNPVVQPVTNGGGSHTGGGTTGATSGDGTNGGGTSGTTSGGSTNGQTSSGNTTGTNGGGTTSGGTVGGANNG